ncbi:sugar-binding transcriptional regulator [Salinibacterium soli]|uniref:Sugar-binding domain-containing protein n=1 Tax=Antiquaquibacter soli TaxID=3064523 RepID=A0ABT9BLL2_9MICO|nr:sugar-binding domain-containing protein [Protaetiibacter sp. WY-16]MDO7880661.1 sugar-binding domain-containing protein [Protaetiibacter sp. WY-16]
MATEPALSVAERSALVAVARRFYLEDRSKVEIADEFGYSRFKVARMLEQARALGVVTITLHDQGTVIPELAQRLVDELGLAEAVVVESDGSEVVARQHVAEAAADVLSRTLRDGEVLGMSWGRTLSAMTEALPSLPSVSVVQLTGTVGSNFEQSPVEIVRKVALTSGGSAYPIFAPMVVDNAATAAALRQQPDVAQAIRMFGDVTTAVLALGSWDPVESQLAEAIPDAQRADLLGRGVVAEVAATLIASDGSLVAPDFADQCIAIGAEQIRAIPRVLLVAAGERKASAARAVLRAGMLSGIVTDRVLAEALLDDSIDG